MSCGLRDVLEVETLDTPAVLVASDAFAQAAERQSVLLGAPDLRYVLVPHPIQDRTDDEMRAIARQAADAVWGAIASPPA